MTTRRATRPRSRSNAPASSGQDAPADDRSMPEEDAVATQGAEGDTDAVAPRDADDTNPPADEAMSDSGEEVAEEEASSADESDDHPTEQAALPPCADQPLGARLEV